MKKRITASILSAALMLLQTAALAAGYVDEPKLNIDNDTIVITGKTDSEKAGKIVSILITNPGYTKDNTGDDYSGIQTSYSTVTSEGGLFEFDVAINSDSIETAGDLVIYISGDDFDVPVEKKIPFAPMSLRENAINDLNDGITADKLEAYKNILSYNSDVFGAVDKQGLANLLNEKNIEFSIDTVISLIYENSVITAFNQGLEAVCIAGSELKQNDVIGLEKTDTELNCTAYNAFSTLLNESGKKQIIKGLLNKNYKTIDDLKKQFVKNTMAVGVTSGEKSGHEHILKLLTSENAAAAGININAYLALNSQQKAAAAVILLNGNGYADEKALESAVSAAAKEAEKSLTTGGTGSGSGSGSGSSSSKNNSSSINIPISSGSNTGTEQSLIFSDLTGYDWAKNAIEKLYKKGIIAGVGNEQFAPGELITREQMAKIICTAFKISGTDAEYTAFNDMDSAKWYAPYVKAVSQNGIMNGIGDNLFGIGQPVTRQDFAVIISRILNTSQIDDNISFTDFDEISDYAKQSVLQLASKNIITGFSDGSFKGKQSCTRAQAAVIIDRALEGGNN